MGVESPARQQFVVLARFRDDSVFQDEDYVGFSDRRQPVRDHVGGFITRQSSQRLKDQFFRRRV